MNGRLLAACISVVLALGIAADRAEAQFSFDIGYWSGGNHHGHGGWSGHYGYSYGWWPRPYYYAPVYVAPPPVVYVPPVVPLAVPTVSAVPPASNTALSPTPTPSLLTTSIKTNSLPAYQGPGVLLRNPSTSSVNVSFVVDGRLDVDLAPGQAKPMNDKSSYVVEFDRGGNFGTARRVISEGTYEFVVTETGWDLQRASNDIPSAQLTPVVRKNALPTTTQR